MKIWVDDVRPMPKGYDLRCRSVNEAKNYIEGIEQQGYVSGNFKYIIKLIDIDHDAGKYVWDGGDYIALLNWLEETGRNYPIRIHSMNPVGVENMRRIIQRNGWREVY